MCQENFILSRKICFTVTLWFTNILTSRIKVPNLIICEKHLKIRKIWLWILLIEKTKTKIKFSCIKIRYIITFKKSSILRQGCCWPKIALPYSLIYSLFCEKSCGHMCGTMPEFFLNLCLSFNDILAVHQRISKVQKSIF